MGKFGDIEVLHLAHSRFPHPSRPEESTGSRHEHEDDMDGGKAVSRVVWNWGANHSPGSDSIFRCFHWRSTLMSTATLPTHRVIQRIVQNAVLRLDLESSHLFQKIVRVNLPDIIHKIDQTSRSEPKISPSYESTFIMRVGFVSPFGSKSSDKKFTAKNAKHPRV